MSSFPSSGPSRAMRGDDRFDVRQGAEAVQVTFADVVGSIEPDTEWRVISEWDAAGVVTGEPLAAGYAPKSGQAGYIWIRRRGNEGFVATNKLVSTDASTFKAMLDIPTGFTPMSDPWAPVLVVNIQSFGILSAFGIGYYYLLDGDNANPKNFSWPIDDVFPDENDWPGSALPV